MPEFSPDQKGVASLTLGDVIVKTRNHFPVERYQPQIYAEQGQYHIYGINPSPHSIGVTADGAGTKPELAERLYDLTKDPKYFKSLAFDTLAMIESDEARFGRILLGVANIVDMNEVNHEVVVQLANGLYEACKIGRFALLNGETAELKYRASGWGKTRLNWNAVGISLKIPDKLILGTELAPEQPIVAFQEPSVRSNGLTLVRTILEAAYLHELGFTSKREFLLSSLNEFVRNSMGTSSGFLRTSTTNIDAFFNELMGHNFEEQVLIPWHTRYSDIVEQLLQPSKLYGPIINEAQGWVDGPKQVSIIAAAHISGGGIPEKVKRMVQPKGLGAHIEAVFPDPQGIQAILDLSETLPERQRILPRTASEHWNRGIGFVVVTKDLANANRLIEIAKEQGYEAAVAGKIIQEPQIEWREEVWTYQR